MQNAITSILGKTPSESDLVHLSSYQPKPLDLVGYLIVQKYLNEGKLQDFIELWRNHFIKHCKPEYLPFGWHVTRPATL